MYAVWRSLPAPDARWHQVAAGTTGFQRPGRRRRTRWSTVTGPGAQISVIPASIADKQLGQSGPSLTAANCTSIRTFGTRDIPLRFSTHYFEWNLTVADVSQPLLGADFLRANNVNQVCASTKQPRLMSRLLGWRANLCISPMRTYLWPRPSRGGHYNWRWCICKDSSRIPKHNYAYFLL